MKLTKQVDYGLLLLAVLAVRRPKLVSLAEVAADYDVPYFFLRKIASQLKEADLVKAKEGAAGGYCLARPAREISLLNIIEALSGSLEVIKLTDGRYSPVAGVSLGGHLPEKTNKAIAAIFAAISLADLSAERSNLNL